MVLKYSAGCGVLIRRWTAICPNRFSLLQSTNRWAKNTTQPVKLPKDMTSFFSATMSTSWLKPTRQSTTAILVRRLKIRNHFRPNAKSKITSARFGHQSRTTWPNALKNVDHQIIKTGLVANRQMLLVFNFFSCCIPAA